MSDFPNKLQERADQTWLRNPSAAVLVDHVRSSIALYMMLMTSVVAVIVLSFSVSSFFLWQHCTKIIHRKIRSLSRRQRSILLKSLDSGYSRPIIVGFFHPYCNAGGGGERVLWAAIRATQDEYSNSICVVYSGDISVSRDAIIERAKSAFGIVLDASRIAIVPLSKRYLVSPEAWPRFTLIGQSLGSMVLAFEAITAMAPDIFIGKLSPPQ